MTIRALLGSVCWGGLLLGTVGGLPAARANIIVNYISDSTFTVQITSMPDLDQRRASSGGIIGLPGNGSMYCVPTATMNTIMYAANHGFPQVLPGPGNWQLQANYNIASNNIATLGSLMGTDAADGTGGNGWYAGAWVWMLASNKFVVNKYYASGFYSPTFLSLSKQVMAGNLVSLAYGRYNVVSSGGGFVQVSSRTGGHAVTFSKAARSGSSKSLWVRDPADDSANLYAQSQFGNNQFGITDLTVIGAGWVRAMSAINYPSNDGKVRLIDGVVTIRPKSGYSFTNDGPPKITLNFPFKLFGFDQPDVQDVPSPGGALVLDVAMHPDFDSLIVATEGRALDALQRIDLATGQAEPIVSIENLKKLAFSRQRDLYALAGRLLLCLDLEQTDPLVAQVVPPNPCAALACDDEADQIVLLSTADRRLLRYNRSLSGAPTSIILPTPVPMMGDGSVVINPLDGKIWFCTDASNSIFEVTEVAGGPPIANGLLLPAVQSPKGLDFDDDGRLFVNCAAGLLEFQKTAAAGWQPVEAPDFGGFPVGAGFRVARSRSNYDPATMDGPAFVNLLPGETEPGLFLSDNPGDLNCDGVTDFADINPFVTALLYPDEYAQTFASCNILNGDLNTDGQADFADINPFVDLLMGTAR